MGKHAFRDELTLEFFWFQELDSEPDCSFFFQLSFTEEEADAGHALQPDLLKTQFSVRYRLLNRDKENEKPSESGDNDEENEERVLTLTPEFKDYKVGRSRQFPGFEIKM